MANPNFTENHPEALLKSLTYISDKFDMLTEKERKKIHKGYNQTAMNLNSEFGRNAPMDKTGVPYKSGTFLPTKLDKYSIFNQTYQYHDNIKDFTHNFGKQPQTSKIIDNDDNLVENIFVVCYHRRFVKKEEIMFQEYAPQLISTPVILSIPRKPCGRRLYDEVWAIASNLLKQGCKFHRPSLRWWERKDWKSYIKKGDGIFKPFVLKSVDRQGYACSKCHWT